MQLENIKQTQPLVSITIPCRNEIKYISNLLNSILESDYE
jgi:glycosyltransferase involved in cell wall biosynthesis